MSNRIVQLSSALGFDPPQLGEENDEHWRWRLYQEALRNPAVRPILRDVLKEEQDVSVLIGVVLRAVELCSMDDRASWLDLASERGESAAVVQRIGDLEIIDHLLAGGDAPDLAELSTWSRWLQGRVTEVTERREVLQMLASGSNYKKVRSRAALRLRQLGEV
ncbi:hypothetical protein ACH35V_22365 [Actinomadura sp. 1N219]|uniref:hypothetical protein n=1 Tax=Actinomadura sp. 1N219 TaxID=3375152 RepID=UPI003792AD7F